jgi:hypothetical protein
VIVRIVVIGFVVAAGAGCAARAPVVEAPSEAARHRAALASVAIVNDSPYALAIAVRTAVPPIQETIIGRVAAQARAPMAPVPAGEPVILVARRDDGAEYQAAVQSFPLDGSVEWRIPKDANFLLREPGR